MHDVLVHYLEVNFPEIAEQLAHARARKPSNEEPAAAAERLRELIPRLRRGAAESGAAWHGPRAGAAERIAGVSGELSPDERAVLDHFFELFARSMERTQAANRPEPTAAEAPIESVVVTPSAPDVPTESVAITALAPEPSPEPAPAATAPPPEPPAEAEREPVAEPAPPEPPAQPAPAAA